MNQISQLVTEFLVDMGISYEEQHPCYRLEIAYRLGYVDAVKNYAKWRDGEQLVGALERPLKTVLAEFKNLEVPVRY